MKDDLEAAYNRFKQTDNAAYEANEARIKAAEKLTAEEEKIRREADPEDNERDIQKAIRKGTKTLKAALAKSEAESRRAQNANRQASIEVDKLVRLMEAAKLDVYERGMEKGMLKV